jgi:NAD(P)-dependent dehydrogenase (short-subunit alcohol dehydrogenase family)
VDHDLPRDRGPRALRAIVTGGARGLGRGIATRLVQDGWDVALVDVAADVEIAAAELARIRSDVTVTALIGDVSDERACERVVGEAAAILKGIDALVNNAGVGGPSTEVVDTDPAEFRRVIDVNLIGAFLMSRAAARVMMSGARGGAIVNVGSIFGQQGVAGGAGYSASKGGVALFTHSLALELAPHGIRVNTVAPGNMATEMHFDDVRLAAASRGSTFADELERVRATVPLGRHGTPEDVGGAIAWLLSDDASYVTGQTIGVNGGVVLT